jgi:hypothetical protein
MKKLTATLITALMAATFAACGGDDDEGPSKADYIEEVDKICARSDAETERISGEAFEDPQDPQPDEAQAFLKQGLPVVQDALEDIEEVEKPKDDEERLEEWIAATEAGITSLEEASQAPETSLTALVGEPFAESEKIADEYGMKACGADD